ncbi:hypothetical protein CDAR_518581 [Caerostris darwini]|uniref:Uncharacterized protein n=1 Tax=Caerostris darwini TaxID=1538125 RepID=A0AAV4UVI9_9ARAC|nr:hypothetical protein CDAR_518581 [Caerostris darwini]
MTQTLSTYATYRPSRRSFPGCHPFLSPETIPAELSSRLVRIKQPKEINRQKPIHFLMPFAATNNASHVCSFVIERTHNPSINSESNHFLHFLIQLLSNFENLKKKRDRKVNSVREFSR